MKKYRDHYFQKAKQENYPARSVYKLEEIDAKFSLFRPGHKILDLGASPGSWTLYAASRAGLSGLVVSIDLKPAGTALPANVRWFVDDVFNPGRELKKTLLEGRPFDLALSDMAPATTGIIFTDQARSMDLACQALRLAASCLIAGGAFVVKIFMGPNLPELLREMRPLFVSVKGFKPKSSRSESKEFFYVGLGFKGTEEDKFL